MIPKNILPAEFEQDPRYVTAFIAGGFAVAPALATDIDVWIQVRHRDDIESVHEMLLKHLNRVFGKYYVVPEDSTHIEDSDDGYGGYETKKVAKVKSRTRYHLPVHVLLTTGGVGDILDSFDISTSQVGINRDGRVLKGSHWTPPQQPGIILRDTETTPERFKKYARRFGWDLNAHTLANTLVNARESILTAAGARI